MKITVGDKQRSFMGAWVLAALLILGVNGLNLTNLLDQPLLGNPREVKGIRRQWKLLEQLSALAIREAKAVADVDLDSVFSRFEPMSVLKVWEDDAGSVEGEEEKDAGPALPVLTGILSVSDLEGNVRSTAVFSGKRYGEKDEMQGFRIERIAEEGVYLTREGEHWFIPAPEGEFTSVRRDLD
jgi:hypothetical protein